MMAFECQFTVCWVTKHRVKAKAKALLGYTKIYVEDSRVTYFIILTEKCVLFFLIRILRS